MASERLARAIVAGSWREAHAVMENPRGSTIYTDISDVVSDHTLQDGLCVCFIRFA